MESHNDDQHKEPKEKINYWLLMVFTAGLITAIYLLVQQIQADNKKEYNASTSSLSSVPKKPSEGVDSFIQNIEAMPKTSERTAFIEKAQHINADGEVTDKEFEELKETYHQLQTEALTDTSADNQ